MLYGSLVKLKIRIIIFERNNEQSLKAFHENMYCQLNQ